MQDNKSVHITGTRWKRRSNRMVELDRKNLRRLQMIELEMLLEVDRICRKHHIPYNIIGGTLLG